MSKEEEMYDMRNVGEIKKNDMVATKADMEGNLKIYFTTRGYVTTFLFFYWH